MTRIVSKQPRKQRKLRYTAPNHVRGQFLRAPLSRTLREQYKKRSLRVIKGDTVKVYRGNFRGTEGIVDEVDMHSLKIVVHGVFVKKADGTEVPRPIDPSNVQITKLKLDDKRREDKLEVK